MNWYKNLKMSSKLIIAFLFMAVIAVVVGVIGLTNILNMSRPDKLLYEKTPLASDMRVMLLHTTKD